MALSPEWIGSLIGSVIVAAGFGGKYVHGKLTSGTEEEKPQIERRFPCADHARLVQCVDEEFKELHQKTNQIAQDVAYMRGVMEARHE